MSELHNTTNTVEERQKQIGLWVAGVYTVLSAVFAGIEIYGILTFQQGRFAAEDYALLPTLIAIFILCMLSYFLIRRGRYQVGVDLLFNITMIPPVIVSLLLNNFGVVTVSYVVVFATIMFALVLPKTSRRRAAIITALAILAIVGIEIWNPGFRTQSTFSNDVISIGMVLTAVVLLAFLSRQTWNSFAYSVSNRLTALVLVVTIPLLIGIIAYISTRAGNEIEAQALHALQENNRSLAKNVATWLELHARSTQELAQLPDIISIDAARQKPTLLVFANTHPNLFLVHTIGLNGINVARSDNTKLNPYNDRAWFQAAKGGDPITFEVLISRTIGKPVLSIAAPIYNESGKIVGVASIVSELSEISKEVLNEEGGGITYIVDASNRVVAHPDPTYTEEELRDLSAYPPISALSEGKIGQITFTDEDGVIWAAYVDRLDNGWGIVAQQRQSELLAPVRQFQTTASILILIGSVVMFALVWFAIRRNLQPIGALTTTVSAIAAGDLSRVAEVKNRDEIGLLASTFNEMTAKLRESFATLEQRVAERTRNLELAAKVGRTVSQVRTLDVMLTEAAELIRKQFDLYYVQVYLVNQSQTYLNLQAGTGNVGKELLGRNHRLPFNSASINGRAAVEKKSVVISDTADSATFKPNPLLPNTRSEMAVPLMIGNRVVGVLDMQSEIGGSLSTDILAAFEALAGQLAIAIQNATFLAETQQARADVEAQAARLTRTNWVDYLDAIHKPEESGFMFEQNKITPLTEAQQTQTAENSKALVMPITVTGEALGNLVVEMEGQSPIARTDELLNTVARQVSQQIENLRLLDSAERYRFEAEEASRRLTREGWKSYVANTDEGMSYVYDLKEVRPQNNNGDRKAEDSGYTLPLKVRDETVGKLVVQGLDAGDSESVSLANAVAERLGAHIESLRQFEETKRGQIELDKRARQLAAVAEVSSVSSRELDIEKMLQSVVTLTQRQFGLYHAHVFTYNENMEALQIAACGWKEGDEHEGTHGTTAIPLAQEQSLVARSARTRQPVIVNDVRHEEGWLPNPLLPDTSSEMAVPLIIGDQILGVLDVQSDILNAFSEEDANIYTTLASQVSTALQNARSFVRAQQQAERESTLNLISQKIQSATTVEAVLQIAARELGHALGAPMTIAQLSMKNKN